MDAKTQKIFYHVISASFYVIVVLSNIISAKMVMLPYFGFIIPAGLVTYPFTFFICDLVTEFFGAKKARFMVYIALLMNVLSFAIIQVALMLPGSSFEEEASFHATLGLSGLRIFSSLTAFIFAQIIDIQAYAFIKHWTGSRFLWLRNNGSTCISQFFDTIIVDMIFFYWGYGMSFADVSSIIVLSYSYKVFFSFACTPLFYLAVYLFKVHWRLPKSFYVLQSRPVA